MRRTAVLLGALLALSFPAGAGAIDYGVTDDAAKSDPAAVFPALADLGLRVNVVSLTWDPASPTALPPDAAQIDRLVREAPRYGVQVAFALYPRRSSSLADAGPAELAGLSVWLQTAARRWPQVRRWIGFNEPNQPRFLQPQFGGDCANASGRLYALVQGTVYDALKSVDGSLKVTGAPVNSRGNDRCDAPSNVSTSPVRFFGHLGRAFREGRGAAGACRPLLDGISIHPYPNLNTDPPARGFAWPNVGVPNLDRLKQAVWDAFAGTCQPTFEEGLTLDVDELGWQTASEGPAYHGAETVPTVGEEEQARYTAEAAATFACDPAVTTFSVFHLIDEPDRERMQTGLLRADRSRKPAYEALRQAVRAGCRGAPVAWRHATGVVGARAAFRGGRSWRKRRLWTFTVTAAEDATYRAGIFRVGQARSATRALAGAGTPRPLATAAGTAKALHAPLVRLTVRLEPGRYVYAVRLTAEANPARSSAFVSRPFTVQ